MNPRERLKQLETETQSLLIHSVSHFQRTGMLWSMGKDSTALLWMARKVFGGKIPFPLFHIDTSYKIPEMISFREELRQRWSLPLQIYQAEAARDQSMGPERGKQLCCRTLKTEPLKQLIQENQLQALIIGIRRDEEGSRSKERYFSLRGADGSWDFAHQQTEVYGLWPRRVPEEGGHFRVHPLLSWTELDVWSYIKQEGLPFCSLYLAKNSKRYRSLGCAPCTGSIASEAVDLDAILTELQNTQVSERAGRAQDQEVAYGLEKLRQKGYM